MHNTGQVVTAFLTMVFGLAIVAVIVSQQANTSGVIQSGATGLASVIGAAIAPVSAPGPSGSNTGTFSNHADFFQGTS